MPPLLTEFHKRRKRRSPIPSASFAAAAWSASSAKKGVKTNRKRGWDSEMECPLYFRRENYREMRENREQKWSVPRKPLLHSQKVLPKGIPPCPSRPESLGDRGLSLSLILPPGVAQNLRKFLWPASPCSYRSRCSRFMEFKGSVRYKSNRETRENRESFMVYFSVFVSFALFAVHRIQRECPL